MSIDRVVGVGGVTVSLVGTGIVVLWPDKRWLGWVFIAVGLLIALLGIVWALAVRHTRKEIDGQRNVASTPASNITQSAEINPQFTFSPVFAPNLNQSQSQTQEQSQGQSVTTKEKVKSEIECTGCYFVTGYLEGSNRLARDGEGMSVGSGGRLCNVAQADFYLKPIPHSDPWIELRAQLIFYDAKGIERLRRVSDGVWREQGNYVQMPLRTGDTRRLVIALESDKDGFASYEYYEKPIPRRRFTTEGVFHHILSPKIERLEGEEIIVKVVVTGKYMDEVSLTQEFWFRLTRLELDVVEISSPRGIETVMKMQY